VTLRQLVDRAEAELAAAPHPERARLDAETLLLHRVHQNRAWLITHWDERIDEAARQLFLADVARRKAGEPIQYITGHAEFFGLPFAVTPDVLIPRPETEHLVEAVARLAHLLKPWPASELQIADIGTGSGAIAIALAHALPSARLIATDLSPQALAVAKENAGRNKVSAQVDFFEGDLLAPLTGQQFHIVASNPPYIPTRDLHSLSVEVRDYEPHHALFADDDGLGIYRRLMPEALDHIKPNGWLVLEIGYGQKKAIEGLFACSRYEEVHFINDYRGIPRVAAGKKRGRED
jgi:release factor glutamine methyltransferase